MSVRLLPEPVRRLLRRVRSLQARLVIVSVLLLTLVCTAVGSGAAISLDGYLTDQLDDQVVGVARFRSDPPPDRTGEQGRREPPPNAGGGFAGGGPGRPADTIEVRIDDGRVVAASRSDRRGEDQVLPAEVVAPALAVVPGESPRTITVDGRDYRMAAARVVGDPDEANAFDGRPRGSVVVVGLDTGSLEGTVSRLVFTEVVVFGVGILVAGFVAAWATRRTLLPLRRVATTARRVSELPLERGEVELAERVPPGLTDTRSEVGQVGASLNRLLGHVEASLAARHESEVRLRRFVADASHELRTPLAAIRGYAELAARRSGDLPPEVAGLLDRVGSQTQRMTALVEDLLLLARLDAGRPLAREPVDLARVVADAVTDAHTVAPAHRWSLDLPEDAPEVTGDPERLHQVVANLLANARTHTSDGTAVTVRLVPGADTVTLEVADDGPGIPAELLPHVFERFARGEAGRARAIGAGGTGSTGLGLSIVSAVVAEHGGTLSVESRPGDTRFRVVLPAGALPSRHERAPARSQG